MQLSGWRPVSMDSLHEVVVQWIVGNVVGIAIVAAALIFIKPRKIKNK